MMPDALQPHAADIGLSSTAPKVKVTMQRAEESASQHLSKPSSEYIKHWHRLPGLSSTGHTPHWHSLYKVSRYALH